MAKRKGPTPKGGRDVFRRPCCGATIPCSVIYKATGPTPFRHKPECPVRYPRRPR